MDGILIINKPQKCTSHDIVQKVKKLTKQKIGHTGTLDPMATGVLPLLIGKGTLTSKYLINHDKKYQVTITLGKKTDTGDSEGKVIEKKEPLKESFTNEHVEKILQTFCGKQEQIPPIYSAIKVKGKKLYEYARKGQKVEIEPRKIEIYDIKLQKIDTENKQIQFEVHCSKGTYIRSLCEDIASKLNTVGYMSSLNRTQVGNFKIENAITVEDLEKNIDNDKFILQNLITLEQLFKDKKDIQLDERKLSLFLNGVQLTQKYDDGIYKIYCRKKFIGIGVIKHGLLKRDIIL